MVNHPSVVKLIDHGEHEQNSCNYPYIVFEPLNHCAKSIHKIVGEKDVVKGERGILLEEEAKDILIKCCEVIIAAHHRGIAYVDIKPEHFFWDGTSLTLIDWNVSRKGLAQSDACCQRDLFRLGALAYYILTGSRPSSLPSPLWSRRKITGDNQLLRRLKERENIPWPLDFMFYKNVLSKDIIKIVETALHSDPAQRYHSAHRMKDELDRIHPMYQVVSQYTLHGKDAIQKGKYVEAHKLLDLAIDDDPDDREARRLLTWLRLAKKNLDVQGVDWRLR